MEEEDFQQWCNLCHKWKHCEEFYSYEDEWCYSCDEEWTSDTNSLFSTDDNFDEELSDLEEYIPKCPKENCIWKDVTIHKDDININNIILHIYCYNNDEL